MTKEVLNNTADDMLTIKSTNFKSVFHLSQLAHPLLKTSGNESTAFIFSVARVTTVPLSSLYGPYKGINHST